MIRGTCRYCACGQESACWGGCSWTDDTRTLCTTCLQAETLAEQVVRILGFAASQARPRINLVNATGEWTALSFEQKQLLVMSVRAIVETVTQQLANELLADARADLIELNEISGFLEEAEQLRDEESISVTVKRLLTPHLGSRIVLPSGLQR